MRAAVRALGRRRVVALDQRDLDRACVEGLAGSRREIIEVTPRCAVGGSHAEALGARQEISDRALRLDRELRRAHRCALAAVVDDHDLHAVLLDVGEHRVREAPGAACVGGEGNDEAHDRSERDVKPAHPRAGGHSADTTKPCAKLIERVSPRLAMRPLFPIVVLALALPFAVATACGAEIAPEPLGLDASLDAPVDVAVDTSDAADAAAPPRPGSTGAFGIVTVGAVQKMYLPLDVTGPNGHGVVAVVDVGAIGNGVAGAAALIADIDLGSADVASTTGGDGTVVVAASIDNRKVWFIDPRTDAVVKTIELDASFGKSGFSGGGGYVTGIAIDSAHHRAILSVWNGFALVDLQTMTLTKVIEAPPSENFGFDSEHQRIIAPFYECATSTNGLGPPPVCGDVKAPDGQVMTDGLTVIDLADDTVYLYQDPTAPDPRAPLGSEPDSAAIDPTTGIVVIPSELGGFQNVLDLSTAVFDKAKKTVTSSHRLLDSQGFEGVAIEPWKHVAFFEEEASDEIAVASFSSGGGASGQVLAHMPPRPSPAAAWTNLGDPHGIAVTIGLADGRAVGFVVDAGHQWVARVDLDTLLLLKQDAGGTVGTRLTPEQTAPAITMLDARTKR
jgi:hypothetical protein